MKSNWMKAVSMGMAVILTCSLIACNKTPNGSGNDPQGGLKAEATSDAAKQHVFRETANYVIDMDWVERSVVRDGKAYLVEMIYSDYCPDTVMDMSDEALLSSAAVTVDVPVEDDKAAEGIDTAGESDEKSAGSDQTDEGIDNAEGEDIEGEDTEGEDIESECELGTNDYRIHVVDLATGSEEVVNIAVKADSYMGLMEVANDGCFLITINESIEGTDENGEYTWTNLCSINKYNTQGELLWSTEYKPEKVDTESYVSYMQVDDNDDILVVGDKTVCTYSKDGQKKSEVKFETEDYMGNVVKGGNGKLYSLVWAEESDDQIIYELDITTGTRTEICKAPGYEYGYNFITGYGYDMTILGSNYAYGYNVGDETPVQIWDFMDSDIDSDYYMEYVQISETQFVANFNDNEEHGISVFTKVDPKDIKDKKIITMAGEYIDYNAKKKALAYNKVSDEYRIRLVDYSKYNTDDDYTLGETRFKNDLISGSIPDIILISDNMPINSFVKKGIFEDLYPFIDKDEDIKREDYFANVLAASEKNGKLYQIMPSFYISTISAKKAIVGTDKLTYEKIIDWEKSNNTTAFSDYIQSDMLDRILTYSISDYLDANTGKCNFDSPEFIKALEYSKRYPKEYDDSSDDGEDKWSLYQTQYRDNRALLCETGISDIRDFNRMEKGEFGEEVVLTGFPSLQEVGGTSVYMGTRFGMSGKSKNKDEVWSFIRQFILPEYQDNLDYDIPVSIASFDKKITEAQKRMTYEDENGNEVEYDETYYLGDTEITLSPITDERAQYLKGYVASVKINEPCSEGIRDIIKEEAAPYFEGQKSAEEVAKIIQSRVQIYVNENQ